MRRDDGSIGFIGAAFGSSAIGAAIIVGLTLVLSRVAHAQEPVPISVLCYNQTQLDILVLARRVGLDDIEAINLINAGHMPVCVRMRKHIPFFDPPLKRILINNRIYEVHGLEWLGMTFEGPRFEYRVALVPAREFGI